MATYDFPKLGIDDGVIPFPPDDWHWAAALEFWLIDVDPRPKFNQKF